MVKFSFLALVAAFAAVGSVSAFTGQVVKKNIKLGNRNLRRGDPVTEALLKKAVPYKKRSGTSNVEVSRHLQEENNAVDGSYYIQFSECMDVKLYDEDLFDENIVNYVQNGKIVAAKSYVLFHVCQKDTCYLDSDDDLYLVDLATYMTNIAQYYANKRTDYCEQCEQYADYCNPQQEEAVEEEAVAEENNVEGENAEQEPEEEQQPEQEGEGEGEPEGEVEGEGAEEGGARRTRKLSEHKFNRMLANAIDCNQCATYQCFDNQENLDDQVQRNNNLENEVSEWIGRLAECQETGVMWDNMNLYVGAMCDSYGDGVELAVFANEDCTWYTNQYAFADVYSLNANENANAEGEANDNINYVTYAEEFIKSAFSEITPCAQLQFSDPNAEEGEEQNKENEMNDYCKRVLEENAVSFVNCAADQENEQEQNNVAANYDWFTYDMEEADDAEDVCAMLKQKQSADYSHAYDQEGSGSWYKRDKSGNIVSGKTQPYDGLSAGAIVGIVIAVLAVLLIAVAIGRSIRSSSRKRHVDSGYAGGEMS